MTRGLAGLLLTGLLIAGCGGSGEGEVEMDGPLKSAVADYSAAFLSGDGAGAYALMSERCQARTATSEFAAIAESAAATYGPQEIKSLKVDMNGDQAQATYTYADSSIDQTNEPWVNEGGWRNDDC